MTKPAEIDAPAQVLLIDDEPEVLKALRRTLRKARVTVATATGADEGLEIARTHRASLRVVIVDYLMPGMDGVSTAQALRQDLPSTTIYLLTGNPGSLDVLDAMERGVVDRCLLKPWDDQLLTEAVVRATQVD